MKKFITAYLNETKQQLDNVVKKYGDDLTKISERFKKISKKGGKVILLGNGGSAATASHVSVDLTKNAKIRSINFNEADLITCFSNDYSYADWMKKSLEFYLDKKDIVVLISTSGKSANIINAAKFLKKNKIETITLTGMKQDNQLKKLNKNGFNLWVNSKSYNQVEIIHHFLLLLIVDLIIGKTVYKA